MSSGYVRVSSNQSLWYEVLPPLEASSSGATSPLSSPVKRTKPLPPTPGIIDASKPVLVVLPHFFCDTTSKMPQLRDPHLRRDFNIVALDLRSYGRSCHGQITPTYDLSVAAADIALAMEALQLPPAHFFAPGVASFQAVVNLALYFPELVLSMTFAGFSSLTAEPQLLSKFAELDDFWWHPEDEEDWEELLGYLKHSVFGEVDQTTVTDDSLSVVVRRYNPSKSPRAYEHARPLHYNPSLTPEILATIKQPVLFLHGEQDAIFPINEVSTIPPLFTSSIDLEFHAIPDGPHLFPITHVADVTSHLVEFLSRHTTGPPSEVIPIDLHRALSTASSIAQNPKMLLRSPRDPESFSRVSAATRNKAAAQIDHLMKVSKECNLRIPGATERETWEEEASGLARRRRWKYSRRHFTQNRTPSQRTSVAQEVAVAVELAQVEDVALESDGGSPPSSHFTTPSTSPVNYVFSGLKPNAFGGDEGLDVSRLTLGR